MNEPCGSSPRNEVLVKVMIAFAATLLVMVGLWWWMNRPIKPVDLSTNERVLLQAKLDALENNDEPRYEKGSKEIIITEREINGLLNENTQLGNSLRFELVRDAIHARLETDLDPDLPVFGGKRLKARARFFVRQHQGRASLVLDDVTVWGISLPNDWLGGIKGRDFLQESLGGESRRIAGVEEFRVESGKIRIRFSE